MSGDGTSFGRYRLLREIGRGGEAIVHLAEDAVLKRRVALKIFPRVPAPGPAEPPEGFRHEVEVLSRLRHPGICTVHDAGIEDGSAFIAMSYVEGRTLADHPVLGDDEVLRLGEEVAGIVAAAHAVSVVHGDVKPENLLVTSEGRCVVLDFGVARLLDDAADLARSNRVAGTLPYLAPECLSRPPDVRADVYGLAAVLFGLVSGRPPHSAPTRAALLRVIEHDDPPLLRAVAPGASRDLEAVLAKALDRDPARRYATMADFAADLGRLGRGEPASARPLGVPARVARWARRNRAAATLAAFALLFLVIAASVTAVKNAELGRNLDRAGIEARHAGDEARAAQEHLVRWERLSDRRRITDLEARAAALLTPLPDRLAALRDWLGEAERLVGRLVEHEKALAEVRARGHTRREAERATVGTLASLELAELRSRHSRLLASPDSQPTEPELRRLIGRLEASLPREEAWSYDSDSDASQDELLSALIADLGRFADPDRHRGTIADVRQRVLDVRTLEESLSASAAAWQSACRSIADRVECPRYGGLVIKPQLGLVPLGRNRDSGLWEFLHVLSGAAPEGSPAGMRIKAETGIVLVLVPGGATRMGARQPGAGDPPDGPHLDPLAGTWESPIDEVTLDPFFISKFEMTVPQWARVQGRTPNVDVDADPLGSPLPMVEIDWNETTLVLARLGLEVPTEAQWEYAARAGTTTPWWTGSDPSSLRGAAVTSRVMAPVGGRRPNAFGLHDVAGNVSEWCRDASADYGGPRVPGTGEATGDRVDQSLRTTRGGGAGSGAQGVRSSRRNVIAPAARQSGVGVRPSRRVDHLR